MEIKHITTDKFSFLTFENVFDGNELSYIWKEAIFLCDQNKLQPPKETSSAIKKDGNNIVYKKKNKGIFLNECYNLDFSNYLKIYTKFLPLIKKEKENLIRKDYCMKLFFSTNKDYTLLSYYENGDYYLPHEDRSCYTYIFWLFEDPKKFKGGNLIFDDIDYEIDIKNNMSVLFPSWVKHSVSKIEMDENNEVCSGKGRFAFSTFFTMGK
jgi:Rps23 Pro-64 3,4-dihydroxylase Tpa1-like proline 4-hydroxylase